MTATATSAESTLDPLDFEFLRSFLLERSAIVLGPDKHYLVASRLGPVARQLGVDSVGDVLAHMRTTKDEKVETRVIEAMTINETLWFRDVKPFAALRQAIIPELVERNREARRISVWSAASSTGQEIYSVAMMLHELPELSSWTRTLIGTDINSTVLETARTGRFTNLEMNRGLPAPMLAKYFARDGAQYVIAQEIRSAVSFMQLNLAEEWPYLPKFDVILLRNVLIYFDAATKEKIVRAAIRQLVPGGFLFLGSAETVLGISSDLTSRSLEGATVYQKGGS